MEIISELKGLKQAINETLVFLLPIALRIEHINKMILFNRLVRSGQV